MGYGTAGIGAIADARMLIHAHAQATLRRPRCQSPARLYAGEPCPGSKTHGSALYGRCLVIAGVLERLMFYHAVFGVKPSLACTEWGTPDGKDGD